MAPLSTATREVSTTAPHSNPARSPSSSNDALRAAESRAAEAARQLRARAARPLRIATDDEILGLDSATPSNHGASGASSSPDTTDPARGTDEAAPAPDLVTEPENIRAALDANPDLRRAWDDAQAYRETFSSPEEARTAGALLADLDRMDALFFSRRPEDHAELARAVASLDPAAFASLAQAMAGLAASAQNHDTTRVAPVLSPTAFHEQSPARNATLASGQGAQSAAAPTQTQAEFFHATNAAAVQSVLESIESQVERLLPEGVSKSARNRVVGEIYRELDTTLRSNRQLAQQMREAFRSGALDSDHQRALVSLVTGRARQALPGVAKRVLNEWTSTLVAANHDRRTRQRVAEHRVDIAGSGRTGSDGQRSMTPRDIDYRRMSDSDILNL
jgi:hypothetical protein